MKSCKDTITRKFDVKDLYFEDDKLMTVIKINKQIDFYTDEIVKLEGIVRDFNGRDLNKYGKHLYNNYMALKQELGEIIDTLRELRIDIEEQIKLK